MEISFSKLENNTIYPVINRVYFIYYYKQTLLTYFSYAWDQRTIQMNRQFCQPVLFCSTGRPGSIRPALDSTYAPGLSSGQE